MPRTRRRVNVAGGELELSFQTRVVGLFRVYGFERIFHAPVGGHRGRAAAEQLPEGRGFPDLLAIKGPRLIVAELKASQRLAEPARLRPGQWDWLQAFAAVGDAVDKTGYVENRPSVESYLWTPDEWDELHDVIRAGLTRRVDLDPVVPVG